MVITVNGLQKYGIILMHHWCKKIILIIGGFKMKKIVTVLLMCVCMMGLVACGNSDKKDDNAGLDLDKNSTSAYIGTWEYDSGKGNVITFYFEKGGIGKYTQSTKENTTWDFTYEVKDEVVVLSRKAVGSEFVASYELNDDGTVLSYITGDMPQGEFKKIAD